MRDAQRKYSKVQLKHATKSGHAQLSTCILFRMQQTHLGNFALKK